MIELQDVGFERPGRAAPVLDGVSFRIAAGERVALLGGNGSGKTTLARLLNGTQLPSRGRVLVDGHDTKDASAAVAVRRAVGLIFQDPDDQFVTTTAEREIAFGLENLRVPTPEMRRAVDAALQQFDLEAHRHAPPHEMSGGEKARLALACVWVMSPRVLVLDESESLLDRTGRRRLADAIASLPAETALVQITAQAEIAAASARVLVLHEGRLVADGTPDDVLAALPAEVTSRTGLPLVWRISQRLVDAGRMGRPTSSRQRVLDAVAATARTGEVASPTNGLRSTQTVEPDADAACEDTLLSLQDVFVWYGSDRRESLALHGVTLAVRPGDRVGLMGASGAGKSTLLHVLAGLVVPQRGRVTARDANRLPSLVFQFPERQLFAETVRQDVAYGLRESGVPRAEVEARVERALRDVGLPPEEFAARPPFHLSGGEMRRVALASALAQQRPVVLLDEPTLGLDQDGLRRLADLLARLHERGAAWWLASHDADFLHATCDRIVVLEGGRTSFDGPASDFWTDLERAERLGVDVPRLSSLAAHLRRLGLRDLPPLPDEAEVARRLAQPGVARA